jgi:hypothetical protein
MTVSTIPRRTGIYDVPFVSVTDPRFGARGDGVADDTAAIQAAIEVLYLAGGGELFFPTGTYVVSATIDVPQRVVLVGPSGAFVNAFVTGSAAPKGASLFLKTGSNCDVVRFRCRLTNNAGVLEETTLGGRNSEARHFGGARNITAWGNRSTDQSPTVKDLNTTGDGFSIEGSRYVTLQNVTAMYCAGDGIGMISYDYGTGAISSNNAYLLKPNALSNGGHGLNLAGGDNEITDPNCGYNGSSGIQSIGSGKMTGGLCWNNIVHGFSALSAPIAAPMTVVGLHAYDNGQRGFSIGTGRAPSLTGCVGRGNGADTGASAADRANFFVSSGAYAWSLVGCQSSAVDAAGTSNVTQYDFNIVNSTYSGVFSGCGTDSASPSASGILINDKTKILAHGAVELMAHPGVTFTGPSDFNGNYINKVLGIRFSTWAAASIAAGAISPGSNGLITLDEAAPTNLTDITYASTGLPRVTLRNGGTNAITVIHNTSKLRLNSGANITLAQHQAIEFTWVSGSVWQHTGGKQA